MDEEGYFVWGGGGGAGTEGLGPSPVHPGVYQDVLEEVSWDRGDWNVDCICMGAIVMV